MTDAERAALLEVMRWVASLEEDAARKLGMPSRTAARLKELKARIEAKAEG